jgi:DNA-binding NarL/FixJ family response regulator
MRKNRRFELTEALSVTAALDADDREVEHRAGRLLTDAGVRLDAEADLVVVLHGGGPRERLAHCHELAAGRPDALIIAGMPPDTSGSRLRRLLELGVHGIVLDDQLESSLSATVLAVASGQLVVPPGLRRQLAPQPLSHREREVMTLVAKGYTNRQIADALYVAESTVKTHLSSAFAKLDTRSRAEAAELMRRAQLAPGLELAQLSA